MRRAIRLLGTLMIVGGTLSLGWAVLVWQWQDPFTAVYTHIEQNRLSSAFDRTLEAYREAQAAPAGTAAAGAAATTERDRPRATVAAARRAVAAEAAAYRRAVGRGDPIGRLTVGALGLDVLIVEGTDQQTLKKGPGRYGPSKLPGEGHLIYVAGHRTTYGAPFADIDRLEPGDWITVEMPYGTFKYVVTGHRIVEDDDLSVLRSAGRETLVLQACHPRFFASHRYLVYARPAAMELPGGSTYALREPQRPSATAA